MEPTRGSYLGTEIDERWWKRAWQDSLLWRGLGRYWTDERGFVFRRLLMQREIVIPFATKRAVKIGRWHAGTCGARQPIVKIVWDDDGRRLSSGVLTTSQAEADRLRDVLERAMRPVAQP